nr:hypothetical protein [Fournierella massiliensis]
MFFAKESIKRWDLNPKRREPAGVRGSTAASGGNREKPAPQRSERGKAAMPPQIGFRAPQGGLRFTFSFFTFHFSLKNSIDRINDKPQQPLGFFERLLFFFFAKE